MPGTAGSLPGNASAASSRAASLKVRCALLGATLAVMLGACATTPPNGNHLESTKTTLTTRTSLTYTRLQDPARTVVTDANGTWIATFTDSSRSVLLAGATRTFSEPAHTSATITHDRWVRLLPEPFQGTVDASWLDAARTDPRPDVLATAMEYGHGAESAFDAEGLRYAGDADYGPLQADGTRQEGSDFNDYLGVTWTYGTSTARPDTHQYGSLDCSGFVRMVFGYRGGIPMTLKADGSALPRRAHAQYEGGPGTVIIGNTGVQATAYDRLQPGDLVFFDASTDDATAIDHVGIYLGVDSGRNHRFVSSRKKANGPTLGDYGGRSILNPLKGTGLYALSFRAARRL